MTSQRRSSGVDPDRRAKVLAVLEQRRRSRRTGDPPKKVTARVLARAFGLSNKMSVETRRRSVRSTIKSMRLEGHPICSDLGGYWLAATEDDWQTYQTFCHDQGVARLAEESRTKYKATRFETAGQQAMFDDGKPSDNLAMVH